MSNNCALKSSRRGVKHFFLDENWFVKDFRRLFTSGLSKRRQAHKNHYLRTEMAKFFC